MKKLLFMMAVGSCMLSACNQEPSYTINGTSEGIADGAQVYLKKVINDRYVNVDSAVVKNNTFKFKGRQDTIACYYVSFKDDTHRYMTDFFLENGNINVTLAETSTATGTPVNDSYNDFKVKFMDINKDMMEIFQKSRDKNEPEEVRKQMVAKLQKITEDSKKLYKETISANITNYLGSYLLPNYAGEFTLEERKALVAQIPAQFRDARIERIAKQIELLEKTTVGKKFIDFTMKDPEGKDVKLSDFIAKNKYTLVDFWASWCGPCRAEMPNVVKAYKEFHKKGFGIVGVSLDNDAEKWKKSIKDQNMTWDQMSDLKGWSSEGAKLYGINSIPQTILIDQEGTIIARKLRGEDLQNKLNELLK